MLKTTVRMVIIESIDRCYSQHKFLGKFLLMPDDVTPDDQAGKHKPSRLIRLLRWKVAIPLILLVWVILTPVLYRQWRLSQVPDIGDPFPVSGILKPIPEEENAFPLFEEAFALWKEVASAEFDAYWAEEHDGWDPTDNLLNKYLKLNRPALKKWREATEKENYQIASITEISESFKLNYLQANRGLVRLCELEIDRLTKTGKPTDAFRWLRATFRCSGLVTRNAPAIDRHVGIAIFAISTSSAEKWMQHPDLSSDQLLELLSVVHTSARLMEKSSTTIQVDYLVSRQAFAKWSYDDMKDEYAKVGIDPPLGSRLETWLFAEPEFSRRLSLHATANYLPFVDAPRRERPPILGGDIFDESAVGAKLDERLPAKKLIVQLKKAKLFDMESAEFISGFLEIIDRHQAQYSCLQVALAAQAYYRDRGEFHKRLSELQPKYLASLPDDPYAPSPATVIYRRTDDGAVVYSRYDNGIDDGGTILNQDEALKTIFGSRPNDFGIRIRSPWKRPLVAPRPKHLGPAPIQAKNCSRQIHIRHLVCDRPEDYDAVTFWANFHRRVS